MSRKSKLSLSFKLIHYNNFQAQKLAGRGKRNRKGSLDNHEERKNKGKEILREKKGAQKFKSRYRTSGTFMNPLREYFVIEKQRLFVAKLFLDFPSVVRGTKRPRARENERIVSAKKS